LSREYERHEISISETVEQYFPFVINLVNNMRMYGKDNLENKGGRENFTHVHVDEV